MQAPPPPITLLAAAAAAPSAAHPAAQQLHSYLAAQHAQLDGLHKRLEIFLPTRAWSKLPLASDLAQWPLAEIKLQHGALPTLQCKIIQGCDSSQANEMDQALLWLSESIGHPYPVVGLAVEQDHSSIRLLQLATSSRCVLIRIPDRHTLYAQAQAAAAHASSGGAAASSAASTLFTPLFYEFLANRQIFKSGLEACTDALQLYTLLDFAGAPDPNSGADGGPQLGTGVHPSHPRCEINSGLNINWNMMGRSQTGGVGLGLAAAASGSGSRAEVQASLEAMCDGIIGAKNSFHVDAAQTYTDWGCEVLTLRQVVYAALNAQVAYVIACTQSLPTPFHISDLPRNWILQAASWRTLQSRQQELSTACSMGLMSTEDESEGGTGCSIATAEARHEVAQLQQLAEFYLARYTQQEEPFNPFISTLLQLQSTHPDGSGAASAASSSIFPSPLATASALASINPMTLEPSSGLAIDATNAFWWFDAEVARNVIPLPQEAEQCLQMLNAQQKAALDAMDRARICIVDGPAGTGKTIVLVAEVLRSLARSSSINLARSSPAVRMSAQRVLCVVDNAYSAAHLAAQLSEWLPPSRLVLFATAGFAAHACATEGSDASRLREGGYMQLIDSDSDAQFSADREVLVCPLSFALLSLAPSTARLLKHRQTVILEDAHALGPLPALLLLRRLPHTERLILSGDLAALAPTVAKQESESILAIAVGAAAALAGSHDIPACFQPRRCSLHVQYRSPPHLALLLSSLFYRGALQSDPRMLSAAGPLSFKKRAIGWVDVPNSAQVAVVSPGGSWSNRAEVAVIARLWDHYVTDSGAFAPSDVAILPLYEAQRRELQHLHPNLAARVLTVEQVQGQQFPLVLLSLSAPGVTHHLSDPRRALVALSRSSYKLFVIGDRDALAPYHSLWMIVEEYVESEMSEEIERAAAEATAKGVAALLPPEATAEVNAAAAAAAAAAASAAAAPVIPVAAAPRRANSGAKSAAATVTAAAAPIDDAPPDASEATSAPPAVTAAPAPSSAVPPSNPWSKIEPSKLLDASVASAAAAAAAQSAPSAASAAAAVLAGLSPEDIPRLANLSSIFALHAPTGQALLIDSIGKLFKARFGTSWRAFERLEREAKLIAFLARFPAFFRLSQNLDESVHVIVEWVAEPELSRALIAAAGGERSTAAGPNGKVLIPVAAPATPALNGVSASHTASGSSGAAYLDPFAFESVLVSDPSLPQLDGELIDALFQALLSSSEPVLLSDLSKTFKAFHHRNWNEWTDLKLGEFLRKYSPAYFKFKNNRENTRNPIVEVVMAPPIVAEKGTSPSGPTTVVASTAITPTPLAPAAAAAAAAAAASAKSRGVLSASAKSGSGNGQQDRLNTQDVFSAAATLATSVPANQIDDLFRLECLRLVFLDAHNCGLLLTEIGNHFHALHGLRWKRLTKTELRLSDFMYSYEGVHFEFEYDHGNEAHDAEGNANPKVYFIDVDRVLYLVGSGGKNKAAPLSAAAAAAAAKRTNGVTATTTSKALQPETMVRSQSTGSNVPTAASASAAAAAASKKGGTPTTAASLVAAGANKKAGAAATDDFLPVTGRHAAKHPSALAASIAAEHHQTSAPASVLCAFCQTIIAAGIKACPNCDSVVGAPVGASNAAPPVAAEVVSRSNSSGSTNASSSKTTHNAATAALAAKFAEPSSSRKLPTPSDVVVPKKGGDEQQPKKPLTAAQKKKAAADAAAAAALAAAEAAAAAEAKAAAEAEAAAAAAAAAPLSSEQLYAGFPESDFLPEADREKLSKKERRKLLWLCPSCKSSNEQSASKCGLCDTLKPSADLVRFKNPSTRIPVPASNKGAAAIPVSASTAGAAAAAGSAASSSSSAMTVPDKNASSSAVTSSSSLKSTPAAAQYENEYVRIAHSAELGYHFLSKIDIPAGTTFLQDDVLWSSPAGALESSMGSCIPNESQFSELMTKLLKDAVMVQHLSNKNVSQYAMIGKLLNLKRPREVGMKEWSAGVEMTLTGAQFQREQAPGHSKSCNCAYGRFSLKRQSALLVHSCWPNSARVKRPSQQGTTKETYSVMATSDIPAGTVLTDCMNAALLSLPRDRRQQWITQTTGHPACVCDRCKTPRKADAALTAATQQGNVKINAAKLESDYEEIIKLYTKLNQMPRTSPDDPAFSSPALDDKVRGGTQSIHTHTQTHGLTCERDPSAFLPSTHALGPCPCCVAPVCSAC